MSRHWKLAPFGVGWDGTSGQNTVILGGVHLAFMLDKGATVLHAITTTKENFTNERTNQ
jgi:hypothetical protein